MLLHSCNQLVCVSYTCALQIQPCCALIFTNDRILLRDADRVMTACCYFVNVPCNKMLGTGILQILTIN